MILCDCDFGPLRFKALLNILALGFSPHGSAAIMATQVDEICRHMSEVHAHVVLSLRNVPTLDIAEI